MLDSRVLAQEKVDELRENGRKVAVASELHWFVPANLSAGAPPIPQVSLARLLRHPEEAKDFDFVVLPLALIQFSESKYSNALSEWSNAITNFEPIVTFGDNATYLDLFTRDPKIGIVPTEAFGAPLRRDAPRVYGVELLSARTSQAAYLTEAGIAAKNYFLGSTNVRLTKPAKTLVVKAQDLNPFEKKEFPTVSVKVGTTTETKSTSWIADETFVLERGGLVEYTRRVNIPPGDYSIQVKANNPNRRFMTEIAYIEFR